MPSARQASSPGRKRMPGRARRGVDTSAAVQHSLRAPRARISSLRGPPGVTNASCCVVAPRGREASADLAPADEATMTASVEMASASPSPGDGAIPTSLSASEVKKREGTEIAAAARRLCAGEDEHSVALDGGMPGSALQCILTTKEHYDAFAETGLGSTDGAELLFAWCECHRSRRATKWFTAWFAAGSLALKERGAPVDAQQTRLAELFAAQSARAEADVKAERVRLAAQLGAHTDAAEAERARLTARIAELERAPNDALLAAEQFAQTTARLQRARTEAAEILAAQTARADAAEAEKTRLTSRVAKLEFDALEHAERLIEETARANACANAAAEAEQTRLADRVAELERSLRIEKRSKRSADAHIAELSAAVAVKREKLEDATAIAAAAFARVDAAAGELDDAHICCVCLTARRQMLYQPCFHLAVCSGCNDDLVRRAGDNLSVSARRKGVAAKPLCPICRTEVESIAGPVFT